LNNLPNLKQPFTPRTIASSTQDPAEWKKFGNSIYETMAPHSGFKQKVKE
jgi:hypothetical protein